MVSLSLVSKTKRATTRRIFILVCLGFILASLLIRFIHYFVDPLTNFDNVTRKAVLFRLDSIAYGVLIYLLAESRELWIHARRLFVIGISIGVILSTIIISQLIELSPFFLNTVYVTVNGIAIMLCIPYIVSLSVPLRISRIATFFSIISYALYLVHDMVVGRPIKALLESGFFTSWIPYLICICLYFLISVLLAYIVTMWIEQPILNLREKFAITRRR